MKYLLLSTIILLSACSQNEESAQQNQESDSKILADLSFYGDTIDPSGAGSMAEILTQVEELGSTPAKIEGTISSCCQKKGCWMKLDVEGYDNPIRVTFKDYGFFVPKNSASNWAVVEGKAFLDTVSVETLRHYAEDAGKSEAEILEITEPEISLSFEAHGVAIKEVQGKE